MQHGEQLKISPQKHEKPFTVPKRDFNVSTNIPLEGYEPHDYSWKKLHAMARFDVIRFEVYSLIKESGTDGS